MTPEEQTEFLRRRKSRNKVMALVLFALVALFYAITIVKVSD